MDIFSSAMRFLIGGFLSLFEARPPMLSLSLISLLAGVAMLWVFQRVSNQGAIRVAKKRLQAHLYELRLFADEPRLIWRAQKGLLLGNLRYLGLMLRPAVILTVPMVLLLIQLEAFYGRDPLPVGKAAIVTVQMKETIDEHSSVPFLETPGAISVETPPVRVPSQRQVSWRIRPLQDFSGNLRVLFADTSFEKSIDAGVGPRYLSDRRVSSALDQLWYPAEKRLPSNAVEWIEIRYPPAEVRFLGLELHWLVWFIVISLASAWLLKGRFRVSL